MSRSPSPVLTVPGQTGIWWLRCDNQEGATNYVLSFDKTFKVVQKRGCDARQHGSGIQNGWSGGVLYVSKAFNQINARV